MPCLECQHRDSVIAELQRALGERDQQLSEVNAKLAKQRLQGKAKWAQLKHQLLEHVDEKEGPDSQKVVENLMSRLEEAENQLLSCRDELDTLRTALSQREMEIKTQSDSIQSLEERLEHLEASRAAASSRKSERSQLHSDVTSEEDEGEDTHERVRQMYAQIVYKDSKMVDLNEMILHRDQKIIDLQESCRERDEVIWAKTKAIQVFQEKLNFYANRDFRDVATETAGFVPGEVDSDAAAGPGRAIAFYGSPGKETKMDEEESSVTTEVRVDASTLMEKFRELSDAVRSETESAPTSSQFPMLNSRLSQIMQQIEVLQSQTSPRDNQQIEPRKKKREKKVTFDFTVEQERSQEIAALTEKLHQAEQACMDLREENDDLRLTIADLEGQIDPHDSYPDSEGQLALAMETIATLKTEINEKEQEAQQSEQRSESFHLSRLQLVEQERDTWQRELYEKEAEHHRAFTELQDRLFAIEMENGKLAKQKEMILSDVDDLREAIETSQQLISGLETDLQATSGELEETRGILERQRREHADIVSTLERDLRNQKLSAKAYETKLHSVEMAYERLSELLQAQKQEWVSLKAEGKEVTGFRLKTKAYEAKLRILQDDNKRLENNVDDLKSMLDAANSEKGELTRDYERKLSLFEQEAKENLALIDRAMAEQKAELEAVKAEFNSEARLKTKAYEAKWRSIERENERLAETVNELESSNQRCEEEKAKISDKLSELEGKFHECLEDRNQFEKDLGEAKEALEKAEERETDLKMTMEKIRWDFESKNVEYASLMDEIAEAQSSVKSLHSQLDSSKSALEQAKEQYRLLSDEKQDLETDLHRLWDLEASLKRRVVELESQNAHLLDDTASLRQRCSAAEIEEQKLYHLTESHELLKQDYAKVMEKVTFLETSSSSESGRLANEQQQLKDALTKMHTEKTQLEKEISQFKRREFDLKEDKDQGENCLRNAEAVCKSLEQELAEQRRSVLAMNEENSALKSSLEDAHSHCEELRQRLDETTREAASTSSLVLELPRLQAEAIEANQKMELLVNEVTELKSRNVDLDEKVSNLHILNEASILKMTKLEKDLNGALAENDVLKRQLEALSNEKGTLENSPNSRTSAEIETLQDEESSKSFLPGQNYEIQRLSADIELLQEQVSDFKGKYNTSLQQVENLRDDLRKAEERISAIDEEKKQREMDNLDKDQSISTLTAENDAYKSDLEDVTLQFNEALQENQRLIESTNEMELERRKLSEERHNLCGEIIALNENLEISESLLHALRADFENLVEENEELKSIVSNTGIEEDTRTELVKQLEKQNREADENYQQVVVYYNDLKAAYTTLWHQYEQVQRKAVLVEAETETDQLELDTAKTVAEVGVNTEESGVRLRTDGGEGQRGSPEQSRPEVMKMKAKLRKMEKTVQAVEAKNRYLEKENASLSDAITQFEMRSISELPTVGQPGEDENQMSVVSLEEESHATGLHDPSSNSTTGVPEDSSSQMSSPHPAKPLDEETERRIAAAMAEASGFQQHVAVLIEQLDNCKSKSDELQELLKKSDLERAHLQNKLDDSNETVAFLKQELDGVKHLFQSVDSEKEELKHRVTQLSDQEDDLKRTLAERSGALLSMQTAAAESNASVKLELDELRANSESMKEQLATAANERDRAHEKMRRLLTSNDELEIMNRNMTEEISTYKNRCADLELLPAIQKENSQLKERMQDLSSILQEWEKRVETIESKAKQLAMENEQFSMERQQALDKLAVTRDNLLIVQKEMAQVNDDNNLLRSLVEELESKNAQLQDEMDTLLVKVQELEPVQDIIPYHKELEQRFHEEMEKREATEKRLESMTADWQRQTDNEARTAENMVKLEKELHFFKSEVARITAAKESETISTNTDLGMNELDEMLRMESTVQCLTVENNELEKNLEKLRKEIDENRDLEALVMQLESKNQALLKEKENITDTNRNLETGRIELKTRLEEVTKEKALHMKRLHALERDVETLTHSLETSTVDSATAKEKEETLRKTVIDLEAEIQLLQEKLSADEAAEKMMDELRTALSVSNEELVKARGDCDVVRALYEQLYGAYGQIEMVNKDLVNEMENTKAALDEKEKNESGLSAAMDGLMSEQNKLSNELTQIKEENESLKEHLALNQEEISKKNDEFEAAKLEIDQLEGKQREMDLELVAKTARIRQLETEMTAKDEEVYNALSELAKRDSNELTLMKEENESLKEQLALNQVEISKKNDEFEAAKLEIDQLEGKKREMDLELVAKTARIRQLETEITAKDEEVNNVLLELAKRDSNELTLIKEENESLKEQLAQNQVEISKKSDALKGTKLEIDQLEGKKREMDLELVAKTAKIRQLETEMTTKDMKVKHTASELAKRDMEIGRLNASLKSALDRCSEYTAAFTNLGLNVEGTSNVYQFLDSLVRERDSFNRQRLELVSKVEAAHVQASNLSLEQEKARTLETENLKLSKELGSLQHRLELITREYDSQLLALQQQLNEAASSVTKKWQPFLLETLSGISATKGADFEENLQRLATKALALESARTILEKELVIRKEKVKALEDGQRGANEKYAILERQANSWSEKCRSLENEISKEHKTCISLEKELDGCKEKCASLETECNDWRASAREFEEMKRRLVAAETDYASTKHAFENVRQLEDTNAQLHQELDSAKTKLTSAERQSAALDAENSGLKERIESLILERTTLQQRIQEHQGENMDLEKRAREALSMNQRLTEDAESRRVEIDNLKGVLERKNEEYGNLLERGEQERREGADRFEALNLEVAILKWQIADLDSLKAREDALGKDLREKEAECDQLNERIATMSQQMHQFQTDSAASQRHAIETEMTQFAAAKYTEFEQEMARLQNRFSAETSHLQEELAKCQREKSDALQWLEQERPKYVAALRNLGEMKEQTAQQERQLESAYLKLAELEVMKESMRESERMQEKLKMEKKELAGACDRLNKELDAISKQLTNALIETESLRSQRVEEEMMPKSSIQQPGIEQMHGELRAVQAEYERLRVELKTSENRNALLMARFREIEYKGENWMRRSPPPEPMMDVETGSEHGDTISLMPITASTSGRGNDELSLQLRREALGSLSADRSVLRSAKLWMKSKIRKYPYLTRRRPSVFKLLLVAASYLPEYCMYIWRFTLLLQASKNEQLWSNSRDKAVLLAMSISNPVEHLFVCASTKEGWPVNIYDASTGATVWSYRGAELQGEAPCQAVIAADEYVFMPVVGRPVIVHSSVQSRNRSHFRSFTHGPVHCLAVTKDGAVCSGSIGEKIYTWLTGNGALTSTVSGHYQAVARLRYTADGSFLISGGKDGRILAWNLVDLLAPNNSGITKPASATKCWSAHSLPVTDLKVGIGGANCRIFSVSLDQSAKIHSLASGQLLVALIFDCGLTACAVDDAETRLFVGTIKGAIIQINLHMQPVARERHVQTLIENTDYPFFTGHKQRITELSVNLDSTLLASGSEDQTVRIWHISSRQCVRTISCNGSVTTVAFIVPLPAMMDPDYVCTHSVQAFQKQVRSSESQGEVIVKLKKLPMEDALGLPNEEDVERILAQLRNEEETKCAKDESESEMVKVESSTPSPHKRRKRKKRQGGKRI